MAILFSIERLGNDFSARADGGPKYFVGRRVPYEDKIGLYNIFSGTKIEKIYYRSVDYVESLGFWASFIEPTAICEGRNFLTLNTYDRAAFTFGFGQFAAHVPNGDFVEYFRALLETSSAKSYFPHLTLSNSRIHSVSNNGTLTQIEDDDSTTKLMRYLNPSFEEVEDNEVIAAAKFIHWTVADSAARQIQIDQMVATFKRFMRRAEARINMNDRPASHCCVIADILHHGRGGKMTWPLIDAAVKSSKPFESLVTIGAPKWDHRKSKLKKAIESGDAFEGMVWDSATHDFSN
jgi:hypothetical protein